MTTDQATEAVHSAPSIYPGRARHRDRRWPRAVVPILMVALTLVAVNALAGPVRSITRKQPHHAFGPYRGGAFGYFLSVPPGTQFQVAMRGHLPDVRVISARAILGPGSVPAATAVSGCRPNGYSMLNQVQKDGSVFLGMGKGDLSTFCTTVANVEGLNLKSLGPQGTLVATVIPMRPGLVETNGFQRRYPIDVYGIEITYVQNGRRITQRTGTEFQYLVQQ